MERDEDDMCDLHGRTLKVKVKSECAKKASIRLKVLVEGTALPTAVFVR